VILYAISFIICNSLLIGLVAEKSEMTIIRFISIFLASSAACVDLLYVVNDFALWLFGGSLLRLLALV